MPKNAGKGAKEKRKPVPLHTDADIATEEWGDDVPQPTLAPKSKATTASNNNGKTTNAKAKEKVNGTFHRNDEEESDAPVERRPHPVIDLFLELVSFAVSVYIVQIAPLPAVDVPKPRLPTSFLSLYVSGGLDPVEHITQMLIAAFFSLFLDTGVVYYHLTNPYHPKFVMLPSRKISIVAHLTSGIAEIVLGVASFVIGDPVLQRYCVIGTALSSITHSVTAYYQTGIVFGAKGMMVPGYIYAVTIHITNAYRLYKNPQSLVFLLNTFLTLHIYVWCRFFIFFFRLFDAFVGYHYTVAIAFSGLLLFPYSLGPIGNYGFLFVCFIYIALHALLYNVTTKKNLAKRLFIEHERYALTTHESVQAWHSALHNDDPKAADQKMAREVFDRYDVNKNGSLSIHEIVPLVRRLDTADSFDVKKILQIADAEHNAKLTFDKFYRYIWSMGTLKQPLQKLPKADQLKLTDREQAKLVFHLLDQDNSGYIDFVELEMLLVQWGLPVTEARAYLDKYARSVDTISFELFYKQMAPIWMFAAQQVFDD